MGQVCEAKHMSQTIPEHRISQVTTQWAEIFAAHGDAVDPQRVTMAQQNVLTKYSRCIYRYLAGATRDLDIAEELTQEFAFRFIRGDLGRAKPEKGRFRDYLRIVLRNLVNDHFRKLARKSQEVQLDIQQYIHIHRTDPFEELEKNFVTQWREQILRNTWAILEAEEEKRQKHFFRVLRFRAEHAALNSQEIAKALSQQLDQEVTAEWVRQKLHRARQRFSEILVNEVRKTIHPNDDAIQLHEELAELQLLEFLPPNLAIVN